jgi:glutaredoxin
MQFPKPQKGIITIYSKSECNYCSKAKVLLEEKKCNFSIINCDKFILENKDEFLSFIQEMNGKEYKLFPMVFDDDIFIGGYNEMIKYIDKSLDFTLNF